MAMRVADLYELLDFSDFCMMVSQKVQIALLSF
jgi:hypothetical protein